MIHRINCFCIVNESEVDIFCNSLAFSMIQQHMLEISVSSAFFKPIPGTSESSQFKYYWSLLFSCQVIGDSVTCGLQHARPPCPSLSPRVCPSSCPLKQWCHPTFSSSVTLFSFCLQSFPASRFYPPKNWLLSSGGQSIGASASASVVPMKIQGWLPLGLTGLVSLLSVWLLINGVPWWC